MLFVLSLPAKAQSDSEGASFGSRNWILYGGPEIGLYGHSAKGSSTSTLITGPRVGNPRISLGDLGPIISNQKRSRELVMAFLAGANFGALTPALDLRGRPRLWFNFEVANPHTSETQLARRGSPGLITFPRVAEGTFLNVPYGEGVLRGIGTSITVQLQGPQLRAGLGPSFEFSIPGDQVIRLKGAVTYSRTILDIQAQTRRMVRLNNDFGRNQTLDDFRGILLADQRTEVYHAVGPVFEIEYDPNYQWGPFGVNLYARGGGSYILNTLKTKMEQCNIAGGQPLECARWKYTQDPWAYHATAGVRLTWTPQRFW